jgi:hypothetical protein
MAVASQQEQVPSEGAFDQPEHEQTQAQFLVLLLYVAAAAGGMYTFAAACWYRR